MAGGLPNYIVLSEVKLQLAQTIMVDSLPYLFPIFDLLKFCHVKTAKTLPEASIGLSLLGLQSPLMK